MAMANGRCRQHGGVSSGPRVARVLASEEARRIQALRKNHRQGNRKKGWRQSEMARELRKVSGAIREAPGASKLGLKLEQNAALQLENNADLLEEAAAILRSRRKSRSTGEYLEPLSMLELATIKAADESGWKGAAILERVGAAALASQHGSEEKINTILANVRKLIKKGKPRQ
jgi:hypothetical protein